MTRRCTLVVACAIAWLSACSPNDVPRVQPGDLLVDAAPTMDVVSFPTSTLNKRVTLRVDDAIAKTGDIGTAKILLATPTIDSWRYGRPLDDFNIPKLLRSYIPDGAGYHTFVATSNLRPTTQPTIFINGAPQQPWLRDDPFPDTYILWDKSDRTLRAISKRLPQNVHMHTEVALLDELGAWDMTLALMGETPEVNELVRRTSVGDDSRAVVFAPAPTRLSFELPQLAADALGVSVAINNRGWSAPADPAGKAIHRRPTSGCAGARFAIDVVRTNGDVERAWTLVMDARDVGQAFVDARVDLRRWRGEDVTLQLVTEALDGASTEHAYCVWGGLRFESDNAGPPKRPHVVLIDIDTLRADRLGTYGYTRPTSPNIDAWADERATVFERTRSTGPYTLPATTSMLTGLDTHQHGVDESSDKISASAGSIATTLRAVGYETIAITEGGYVSPDFGFDHGFDRFTLLPTHEPDWTSALERFDRGAPLFLFFQTFMVHSPFTYDSAFVSGHGGQHDPGGVPYEGPFAREQIDHKIFLEFRRDTSTFDNADERYVSDLYDAGVLRMDTFLVDVLDHLASLDDDVLVILTSDHGEELFERDMLGHGQTLYNELLHVPLMVSFPDGRTGRDARTASLVDIVPTILDVVGLDQPAYLPGHSLAQPAPTARTVVSRINTSVHALETASGDKLVDGSIDTPRGLLPGPQLFDVAADPRERNDLAAQAPDRVDALTRALAEYLETWIVLDDARVDGASDSATQERLRELGYLDVSPAGEDR